MHNKYVPVLLLSIGVRILWYNCIIIIDKLIIIGKTMRILTIKIVD